MCYTVFTSNFYSIITWVSSILIATNLKANPSAFPCSVFCYSHFQICTLLFTIYIVIIHKISKFMHELLSVYSLSLSLSSLFYTHQCDELCSSHHSESIRFDSIQFEFLFKFDILFSMEMNSCYSSSRSRRRIFSFCLLSYNERKYTHTQSTNTAPYPYTANSIIYSFCCNVK